jgi:hypothetical protein
MGIPTISSEQFSMTSDLCDPTVLQNNDTISMLDRGQAMRNH